MRRAFATVVLFLTILVMCVPFVAAQEVPSPTPVAVTDPAPNAGEPQDIDVPGWVLTIVNFFAQKYVLPFSAALGAALIAVVGLLRQVLAAFGAKLGPKGVYIATALLAFLTAFATAAADGSIAGDEWTAVVTGLAAFIAAIFGYRLTFSAAARARLGK